MNRKIKKSIISLTNHCKHVVTVTVICLMMTSVFACGIASKGKFVYVNGKEIYMEGDQQVVNKLVVVDGEEYYIGPKGSKITNAWEVVDNDGNQGFFGVKGQRVKNQVRAIGNKIYLFDKKGYLEVDGLKTYKKDKYYASKEGALLQNIIKLVDSKPMYFGEDGKYIKNAGHVYSTEGDYPAGFYYFDKKGDMLKSVWKDDHYYEKDGRMATNQWIGDIFVDENGKKIEKAENTDKSETDMSSKLNGMSEGSSNKKKIKDGRSMFDELNSIYFETETKVVKKKDEIYISGHERRIFTSFFNWKSNSGINEVNNCEVIFDVPIIGGDNDEEVNSYNRQISNLVDQYFNTLNDWKIFCRDHKLYDIEAAAYSLQFLSSSQSISENNGKAQIYLNATELYSTGTEKYLTLELKYAHKFIVDRENRVVQFYVNTKDYPYGGYNLEMNYVVK